MSTLIEDARELAEWVAGALTASGYQADFTLASLKEIDRFLDDHSQAGEAVPGGLLCEDLGHRLFVLGAYVGEVNLRVVLAGGAVLWPVQRVMKRFQNGPEESVYAYGRLADG